MAEQIPGPGGGAVEARPVGPTGDDLHLEYRRAFALDQLCLHDRAGGAGAHEGRITGDAVRAERGQVCDRLNEVGLALAVGAHEGGDARLEGENNVFVRPEVRQGEVRYIHHSSAGLTACPPNWFRSAAMAFIAGESSCRETKRAYREALMTGVGTA